MAPRTPLQNPRGVPPDGRGAKHVLLTLCVLGVLGLAWGVRSLWPEDAATVAEGPGERTRDGALVAGLPVEPLIDRVAPRSPAYEPRLVVRPGAGEPNSSHETLASSAPGDDLAAANPVLQALLESDDETRLRRLEEAIGSGAEVPLERMQEVLATDRSDKVRELALIALTEHPDFSAAAIRELVEAALGNTSLAVRSQAGRILERMDELERIDRESRANQMQM